MRFFRSSRRSALLLLTMLSACAAAGPAPEGETAAQVQAGSAFGAYLAGSFAASQNDLGRAARDLLAAHAADPTNVELARQAFLAAVLDDRPEAAMLARSLGDDPAAQLLLGDDDARAGRWEAAERRFSALPRQGLTELLQPLLTAWAEAGGGHFDTALATLRPYIDGPRFRGVFALHAAMIADLGERTGEAGRLYHAAQLDYGGLNLPLAQILASWQARQGHQAEAAAILRSLGEANPALSIAIPRLIATDQTPQVSRATQGIAEAYLALAAALHQQDADDYAQLLLQLAIDMRPDLTPARLLMAEIVAAAKHPDRALAELAPVSPDDPLAPLVALRRAQLQEQMGDTETAMRTLDALSRAYPTLPQALTLKGDILREKSRFGEAIAAYDEAIARVAQPRRADWILFYDRGIALERDKQWPKAQADFERALELSPDQPYVLNYLAYSWAERGEHLAHARKMAERAAELRPADGAILDTLGFVLLRQGDNTGAVRWLERAVEIEPEDSTINAHLGDAYWAIGRRLDAQYQWQLALNFKPEPGEVAGLEKKLHEAEAATGTITANGATAATGATTGNDATTATAERRVQ